VNDRGRRGFLRGGLALAGLGLASACGGMPLPWQRATKIPRIGYLGLTSTSAPQLQGLRDGLRELGYQEGQTIAFEERWGASNDQLPVLAGELARLPVDLIVAAAGNGSIRAALDATRTIPIVFVGAGDPVQGGFVASLSRPGGNATGTSALQVQVGPKRLQLLRETAPGIVRVLALTETTDPSTNDGLLLREAAQALGVELMRPTIRSATEVTTVLDQAIRERADALFVGGQPLIRRESERIIEFAARHRLPAMYDRRELATAGGLMSYGPDLAESYRRTATYVDRILKGASPAELPIEQATRFEFVVNLPTARSIGLTIPQSVLQQATEVIE